MEAKKAADKAPQAGRIQWPASACAKRQHEPPGPARLSCVAWRDARRPHATRSPRRQRPDGFLLGHVVRPRPPAVAAPLAAQPVVGGSDPTTPSLRRRPPAPRGRSLARKTSRLTRCLDEDHTSTLVHAHPPPPHAPCRHPHHSSSLPPPPPLHSPPSSRSAPPSHRPAGTAAALCGSASKACCSRRVQDPDGVALASVSDPLERASAYLRTLLVCRPIRHSHHMNQRRLKPNSPPYLLLPTSPSSCTRLATSIRTRTPSRSPCARASICWRAVRVVSVRRFCPPTPLLLGQ